MFLLVAHIQKGMFSHVEAQMSFFLNVFRIITETELQQMGALPSAVFFLEEQLSVSGERMYTGTN